MVAECIRGQITPHHQARIAVGGVRQPQVPAQYIGGDSKLEVAPGSRRLCHHAVGAGKIYWRGDQGMDTNTVAGIGVTELVAVRTDHQRVIGRHWIGDVDQHGSTPGNADTTIVAVTVVSAGQQVVRAQGHRGIAQTVFEPYLHRQSIGRNREAVGGLLGTFQAVRETEIVRAAAIQSAYIGYAEHTEVSQGKADRTSAGITTAWILALAHHRQVVSAADDIAQVVISRGLEIPFIARFLHLLAAGEVERT